MQLSPRLKLIADLVKPGSVLADIGTDHGYVPVYCVSKGICPKAIAMDVNSQPLEKAKENISKYGLEDFITTRLSDGLEALSAEEADSVVIAGMGGLLIMNILEQGAHLLGKDTQLLLQPMLAQKELRQYLYIHGFEITDEYVCREDDKFYNIISAKLSSDKGTVLSSAENDRTIPLSDLIIGKNIDKNSPDVYPEYLDYKIGVCSKIINGLKMSKTDKTEELIEITAELEIFLNERKRFDEA
ncbi:MAG: SAM-dependent methyltransferase [Clostridia bacterium]|nr:SAM-dependent methyltransferase [Clostridia bacterium]